MVNKLPKNWISNFSLNFPIAQFRIQKFFLANKLFQSFLLDCLNYLWILILLTCYQILKGMFKQFYCSKIFAPRIKIGVLWMITVTFYKPWDIFFSPKRITLLVLWCLNSFKWGVSSFWQQENISRFWVLDSYWFFKLVFTYKSCNSFTKNVWFQVEVFYAYYAYFMHILCILGKFYVY